MFWFGGPIQTLQHAGDFFDMLGIQTAPVVVLV